MNTRKDKKPASGTRDFDELLMEILQDKEEAAVYLRLSLEEFIEDHDETMFLQSLNNVARAQGKAKKSSGTNTPSKCKTSPLINASADAVGSILKSLGLEMTICVPSHQSSVHHNKGSDSLSSSLRI